MRAPASRGVLWILALLLAASGALRLGSGLGVAFANSGQQTSAETEPAPPLVCPEPPVALAEALRQREEKATQTDLAIKTRMAALDLAEKAIAVRLAALAEAETSLKQTLSVADGAAEEDLLRLTAVYETMKPKDAAKLFEAMTAEFAAGFLGRMRPDAAAAVMSGMSPEAGYAVSAILAGRNATVPKE